MSFFAFGGGDESVLNSEWNRRNFWNVNVSFQKTPIFDDSSSFKMLIILSFTLCSRCIFRCYNEEYFFVAV